jgi:hypothetical protein
VSSVTAEQNDWVTKLLGISISVRDGGAAEDAKPDATAGADGVSKPAAMKGFLDRFRPGKKAGKSPAPQTVTMPRDKELAKKLKTLTDAIAEVGGSGFDTKQMLADADDLGKQLVKAEAEADATKRQAAVKSLGTRVDEELEHVRALAKSAKEVMGKSKDKPNAGQKSAIYKKALKDYYGLDIEVPPGMTNTHFDKMFDMFGTVPKSHTKQDKLKKLKYSTDDIGGVFYYADCKIEMGNFGDATRDESDPSSAYELDGKQVEANSFNVTALHEIGHSVDYKNRIMDANQAKDGCGAWQLQTVDGVATVFVGELKNATTLSPNVTDAMLTGVVKTALSAGTITQPNTIGDDDWQKILPFVSTHCIPVRDDSQPYFKNSPVVIGGRAYTESQGEWWSYSGAARTATRVNNYQWRSPAEWFAEVYAITWLKKHKPPSQVDAAVAKFCWNG